MKKIIFISLKYILIFVFMLICLQVIFYCLENYSNIKNLFEIKEKIMIFLLVCIFILLTRKIIIKYLNN